jgi:hypothetical protein
MQPNDDDPQIVWRTMYVIAQGLPLVTQAFVLARCRKVSSDWEIRVAQSTAGF